MEDQRRSIRVPVTMHLEVSDIFKQDNVKVSNIHAPIRVVDISRDGMGFVTKSILPIGFYFNARLEFDITPDENDKNKEFEQNNVINCVIQIIRQFQGEDEDFYHYGCIFTGMPSIFDYIFDDIEKNYQDS